MVWWWWGGGAPHPTVRENAHRRAPGGNYESIVFTESAGLPKQRTCLARRALHRHLWKKLLSKCVLDLRDYPRKRNVELSTLTFRVTADEQRR